MPDSRVESVLIVEDDPGIAHLEERRLRRSGYSVVSVFSATEAMGVLERDRFDLIVLDQKLPGGTAGLDFYARVRELGHKIPAILVTGLNDEGTLLRAIRSGLRDFVPKTPDFLDDLASAVDRVMRQVRVERQLAESESRLSAIIASAIDAVVSIDAQGRIRLFNPAAERVFGISQSAALRKPIHQFLVGEPGDSSHQPSELLGIRADGSTFPIEVASTASDTAGAHLQTLFIRDLTSRKQAEAERAERIRVEVARAEAEAANQAKDQFIAMLSHELRTPMNPVLLSVSEALDDPNLPEEWRPLLEMVHRNVRLQARLIDDLLDVTRIARGKLPLRRTRVDLNDLLHQTVDICRSDIHDAALHLDLDLRAEETIVHGDPTRLQQVLWNLLKNAVKFTPSGGRITISTWNEPSARIDGQPLVRLSVQDTGIGIEPHLLDRLFEPFEQGGPGTTHRYGGLGLGLAISRWVAEAHEGLLAASSPGPGRGSTFTLTLATMTPTGGEMELSADRFGSAEAQRRAILLVEDDPDNRRALQRALERRGYRVESVESIAEATAAAAQRSFDLVISDMRLPDGDGLVLLERLQALRPIRGIVLSGVGRDADIKASLNCGYLDHLIKPVDAHALEESIRRALAEQAT